MLTSIRKMAHGLRDYERRRAMQRLVGQLDPRVLRDVGLDRWQDRG